MNERLNKQLEYIKKNIPYYKKKEFEKFNKLEQFPLINKNIIRDNYNDFISLEIDKDRIKLIEFLQDPNLKKQDTDNEIFFSDDIIIEETSGTSGVPFRFFKTKKERTELSIELWKQRWRVDKKVNINNFFQFNHISLNMKKYDIYDYSVENLLNIYNDIDKLKSRWLHTAPSVIIDHITVLKKNGIQLNLENLKFIECNGQFLNKEMKETIEEYFNVIVLNQYGSMETWPMALSCKHGNQIINSQSVIIELIDDEGKIIKEPYKEGRVVVTTLVNKMLPFIRYITGDFAFFSESYCECGLKKQIINLIEGREINLIKGVEEKVFGNILFYKILRRIHFEISQYELKYIQIVQTSNDVFKVFINDFDSKEKLIELLKEYTQYYLKKEFIFEVITLTYKEIQSKNKEKPNIFLCKV